MRLKLLLHNHEDEVILSGVLRPSEDVVTKKKRARYATTKSILKKVQTIQKFWAK
jgi:hypothetical protein